MKKNTLLIIVFVLGTNLANATIITSIVAQKVAGNFYKQNSKQIISNISLAFTETSSKGEAIFYAFNINKDDGFVIISADSDARPVIGYSTHGQFVVPKAETNIAYWLTMRKNEITDMRKNHYLANNEIISEWTTYSTDSKLQNTQSIMAVAPLIQTTWGQDNYYNALCPGNSPTGCGATTMAQIMRFWNYPAQGTGSSSYCDCTSGGCSPGGFATNYGTLSVNYGATTYNWSNMPLNVISANIDVATIMYQCGVSVQMDYSPAGSYSVMLASDCSVASSEVAYVSYFKYDPATLQGLYKSDYSDANWVAILKNDLNFGRPIHYFGNDENLGGHFWVCDGYDTNDNFHMNWGWNGSDDGYFPLTNLTTNTGAVYNPVGDQEALIGIQPIGTAGMEEVNASGELSIYPNPATTSITISGNNQNRKMYFTLVDITGRVVKADNIIATAGTFNETFAISDLSQGLYFLKAFDEKNVWVKKLDVE